MTTTLPPLLGADDVSAYLASRGLTLRTDAAITTLEGGVSASVFLVENGDSRWVVKQALPELKVASLWRSDPRRALTEARALRVAGSLIPGAVPGVVDADAEMCSITMMAAPATWENWRTVLLTGSNDDVDSSFGHSALLVAERLGSSLGILHRKTWGDPEIQRSFSDDSTFEDLRVSPFYRSVSATHPQVSPAIEACITEVTTRQECLVHGDFSPKNILVGPLAETWILDFEVARYGAAVFDLAFLGHHLALKALHNPQDTLVYHDIWRSFLGEYRATNEQTGPLDLLGWHTAALLLARIDGVSPVPYLGESARKTARDVALQTLSSGPRPIDDLWELVITNTDTSRTS